MSKEKQMEERNERKISFKKTLSTAITKEGNKESDRKRDICS